MTKIQLITILLIGAGLAMLDPAFPVITNPDGTLTGLIKAPFALDPDASELGPVDQFPAWPYARRWMVTLAPTEAEGLWTVLRWKPLPALIVKSWREAPLLGGPSLVIVGPYFSDLGIR